MCTYWIVGDGNGVVSSAVVPGEKPLSVTLRVLVGRVGIAQSKNNLQLNQMKPVPSGLLSCNQADFKPGSKDLDCFPFLQRLFESTNC